MSEYRHLIGAGELEKYLHNDNWKLVDCRFDLLSPAKGRQEFVAGHIPSAVYADLDQDLAAPVAVHTGRHPLPDADVFAATLGSWGIDNESQVIAYDNSGGAIAARLWWMLRWLGHANVAVLDGGLDAWIKTGGKLETGESTAAKRTFEPREDRKMVISTDDVRDQLDAAQDFGLFDARDERRFTGEIEPIDPVAGHVPHSHNFPFSKSLTRDGSFRSAEDLAFAWEEALAGRAISNAAVMCGSGVTACHLALSADLAGLGMPRLYIGSWSEWIREPGRPVATGAGAFAADSM